MDAYEVPGIVLICPNREFIWNNYRWSHYLIWFTLIHSQSPRSKSSALAAVG